MRKYVLTSEKFDGSVTFGYADNDILILYADEADMKEEARRWLLARLPVTYTDLERLQGLIKGTIVEAAPDLSFNAFYEAYKHKVQKKRALAIWNKLSDEDKLQAIFSVKPYLLYLQRVKWRNQADPDTYLRNAMYETDWNKQHK